MQFLQIKTKKLPAFSLVEMLVVVAIIVLMTGVFFVSQKNAGAKQDVDLAEQKIMADLRSLQNDTLNGKMHNDHTVGESVFFNGSNKSYKLCYYYADASDSDCSSEQTLKNVTITSNKNASSLASYSTTAFNSINATVVVNYSGNDYSINLSNATKYTLASTKNSAIVRNICIDKDSGNIYDC